MSESNHSPLINSPSAETIDMPAHRGGSNKRALKVAGVTLLAGILIVGQAFTTYMAFSHKQQLETLERRTDRLQEIGHRSMAMRTPVKMHLPMSSLALALDVSTDDKKDSSSSTKPELSIQTQCQKEAVGEVKNVLPGFRPKCDSNGDYLAQQCWDGTEICWCVDKNGNEKTDSVTRGTAECETAKLAETVPMSPLLVAEEEQ